MDRAVSEQEMPGTHFPQIMCIMTERIISCFSATSALPVGSMFSDRKV